MVPSWCSSSLPAYFPPPGEGAILGAGGRGLKRFVFIFASLHPYLFSSLLIKILSFPQGKLKGRKFCWLSGGGDGAEERVQGEEGAWVTVIDSEVFEVTCGAGGSLLLLFSGIPHLPVGLQTVSALWTLYHLQARGAPCGPACAHQTLGALTQMRVAL